MPTDGSSVTALRIDSPLGGSATSWPLVNLHGSGLRRGLSVDDLARGTLVAVQLVPSVRVTSETSELQIHDGPYVVSRLEAGVAELADALA